MNDQAKESELEVMHFFLFYLFCVHGIFKCLRKKNNVSLLKIIKIKNIFEIFALLRSQPFFFFVD